MLKRQHLVVIFALLAAALYGQEAEVAVFPQLGHSSGVRSVAFSPDGKLIASGSRDNTVKLWDAASGREIRSLAEHTNTVWSVAFSPNGKLLAFGSGDNTVKLWDAASGREIRSLGGHTASVTSVAFSPDGKFLVSGSWDNTVKLWDTASGREIRSLAGHMRWVTSVAFSPDGKFLASGSRDETVKLWDTASGRELRTLSGHADYVLSVAFSPDGKFLASGSLDKTVKLWDTVSGRELRTLSGHTWSVESVAFSPDGKLIASSGGKTVKLWEMASGQELRSLSGDAAAFSPDGKLLASAEGIAGGIIVKLWEAVSGQELRSLSGHTDWVSSVTFSLDGKLLAPGSYDKTVKLWDAVSGRELRTLSGHADYVLSVAFSPDGKLLASGSGDRTVKLWDTSSGRELCTLSEHTDRVSSVTFSPDGKLLASGSGDKTVKLWDTAGRRELCTLSGHSDSVRSVAFSPDGKLLASGSGDETVKLWDTSSGRELRTLSGHVDSVTSATFSPDGKFLASGSWRTVKLWDMADGRMIRSLAGHTDYVTSVTFSPDGKLLASGSWDGTVKLWDAAAGREIRSLAGHTSGVLSAAFSSDGKRILSGSADGTARLWDAATGEEIVSLIGFSGADSGLAAAARGVLIPSAEENASSIDGEWIAVTPDGYYAASPRGDRYLNVRIGNTVTGIDSFRSVFDNPDVVKARLAGEPDPPSKRSVTIRQAARFLPPEISLQADAASTAGPAAGLSVSIADKNLPIQTVKIMVNGRLLGRDELAAVSGAGGLRANRNSLTVTGGQQTLSFSLPLRLDPGNNRIEVAAFNGFSENRRYVDLSWDAPAGALPVPPDLWILAVGVNEYDNAGERLGGMGNLNFCVADVRGVIEALENQEGRRYGRVHSLLVADDAEIRPTAANIRESLRFLEGAGDRDVALLFLAGHGVSEAGGKFFFLGKDAVYSGGRVDPALAISGEEIAAVLEAPGNRLVFIDACQSGGVDSDRLVRSLMDTNAMVFASSRGNEYSYEKAELGHGVFTYSVMEGLKGAAGAGEVSVLGLSGFVSGDVPRLTEGRQHPGAYSLGFYDFPMALFRE